MFGSFYFGQSAFGDAPREQQLVISGDASFTESGEKLSARQRAVAPSGWVGLRKRGKAPITLDALRTQPAPAPQVTLPKFGRATFTQTGCAMAGHGSVLNPIRGVGRFAAKKLRMRGHGEVDYEPIDERDLLDILELMH